MYCPRCSQQQVTDDVSYCSRCGFQLGEVRELLVTDGAPPSRVKGLQFRFLSGGGKSARIGAKLVFFSLVSLLLFFPLSVITDSPGPFVPPMVAFIAGLTLILYARIFGEDIVPSRHAAPRAPFERSVSLPQTPFQTGTSANELGAARVNTAEMVPPPSVTERTTNLL
jgi:hypothetical protein